MPSINQRKAGKYTEDPLKNLPQLPEKRLKQTWIDPNSKLDLQLNPNENQIGKNSFDLIKEINASNNFLVFLPICIKNFFLRGSQKI